jgi:hypothetical protein
MNVLAGRHGGSASAHPLGGSSAGHTAGVALDAVALGGAPVAAPAAPATTGPTGQGQPTGPTPAPYRRVGPEAHRGALDPVFTDLDDGTIADTSNDDMFGFFTICP